MEEGIVRLAKALDTEDMIGFTKNFIEDFKSGLKAVNVNLLPWIDEIKNSWTGVICLGMGGSAAGGDFLSTLSNHEGTIPVVSHRGYNLPQWWTTDWLVISTSYSGNTEETLDSTRKALAKGATIIVVSSGGELAGMCELSDRMYLISCPSGQPPRSAFGHIFSRQLALLAEIGVLKYDIANSAINRLEQSIKDCDILSNPEGDVASLALNLMERRIAILGPSELGPAMIRMKNQLNENSARFARIGEFPEMNHNELVAWGGVGEDGDKDACEQAIILMSWQGLHERVEKRMDWFISNSPSEYAWKLAGEGDTLLECLLHICIMMDWLSIALALLHGKNPSSIKPIISLKEFLNQASQ